MNTSDRTCNFLHIEDQKMLSKSKIVIPRNEAFSETQSKLKDLQQIADDMRNVKNSKSLGVLINALNNELSAATSYILSEFSETMKQLDSSHSYNDALRNEFNSFCKKKSYVVMEIVPNVPNNQIDPPCARDNVHFITPFDLNNVSFVPHFNIIAENEAQLATMFEGKHIIPIRCTDISSGKELLDISYFIERIFGNKLSNMKKLDDKELETYKEYGTLTPTKIEDDSLDEAADKLIEESKKAIDKDNGALTEDDGDVDPLTDVELEEMGIKKA